MGVNRKNNGNYYLGKDARGRRCWRKKGADVRDISTVPNDSSDNDGRLVKLKTLDDGGLEELINSVSRSDVTLEALDVAHYAHEGVERKQLRLGCKEPYVSHVMRNSLRGYMWSKGRMSDEDCEKVMMACLLHDTVEDAPDRICDYYGDEKGDAVGTIRKQFGDDVADAVVAVTNPPKPDGLSDEEKRQFYVSHLRDSLKTDMAIVVKAADLWDNAGSSVYGDAQSAEKMAKKYIPAIRLVGNLAKKSDNKELGNIIYNEMKSLEEKIDVWS